MPVSRSIGSDLAATLAALYAAAEQQILEVVTRQLAAGIERDDWAVRKLAAIGHLQAQINRIVARLQSASGPAVEQALVLAYVRGGTEAFDELARLAGAAAAASADAPLWPTAATVGVSVAAVRAAFPEIDAVQELAWQTASTLAGTHVQVLRWPLDAYRAVVAQASSGVLLGAQTRRQAAQSAWEKLVDQGITGFTDKAGRRWQLSSYVEMAVRSAVIRAAVQGHLDRLHELGRDLVIVSDSPQECPLCRPWEGKVLSRDGTGARTIRAEHATVDDEWLNVRVAGSVAEAIGAGLLHPNCTHNLSIFLPGVTRAPARETATPQGYADRQRLRELERHVRAWKRRQLTALDPAAKARAAVKVKAWQAAIRDHVAATGLLRQNHREQLTRHRGGRPVRGAVRRGAA